MSFQSMFVIDEKPRLISSLLLRSQIIISHKVMAQVLRGINV